MAKELKLELDDSIDEVIDELPGNSFIALRKLRWNSDSPFKLDIRKWFTNNEGEEIAGKGVAFMTEEGPGNLIEALLKHGYGDTEKTLNGVKDREDFLPSLKGVLDGMNITGSDIDNIEIERDSDGSFYDPKALFSA